MVRSKIIIRGIGAHDGMRFPDLIRFGPNQQPPETGGPAEDAMQIAGNDNIANKLTSLQAAAESEPTKLNTAPEDANPTEAEKIAAAVDLAISLEDG
jgi:hypothetical protein